MSNNEIKFPNGKIVFFEFPIEKNIEVNNGVIVLLSIPWKIVENENIFYFSKDGELIWQIEKVRFEGNCPYVNILLENDTLVAINYDSWREEIDLETGKIISSKYTK